MSFYAPDVEVQVVDWTPRRCGEWQFVDVAPDIRVEFVDCAPDIRVQFVEYTFGIR